METKLCECGCGMPAPIAKQTDKRRDIKRGQIQRFVQYHANKSRRNTVCKFWNKIDILGADKCWNWKGAKDTGGYGIACLNGKAYRSSRLAFILSGGVLTKDQPCVLHHCDNRACCNPHHLFAGSIKDNNTDMIQKGRGVALRGEENGHSKLKKNDVLEIRMRRLLGERVNSIAKDFPQVTYHHVHLIASGKEWEWI